MQNAVVQLLRKCKTYFVPCILHCKRSITPFLKPLGKFENWTPTGIIFYNIEDLSYTHMGDRPLQVAWERTPGWIPMECCSTCSEEPSIRSNDCFSTLERGSSSRWEVFPLKVSDWNGASKTTKTMTFADCGSECRANLIKDKSCHGVK